MIFINCKKCLLCPYVLMTYELNDGICSACCKTKKENEDLEWFDSLFAEPESNDAA